MLETYKAFLVLGKRYPSLIPCLTHKLNIMSASASSVSNWTDVNSDQAFAILSSMTTILWERNSEFHLPNRPQGSP